MLDSRIGKKIEEKKVAGDTSYFYKCKIFNFNSGMEF